MVALIAAVAFSAIAVPSYAIRILSSDIVDGEVKTADIANNAVTSSKIGSGQVNNADIANSAVTADKIKTGEIQSGHIADGTIQSADIAEGVIPTDNGNELQLHKEERMGEFVLIPPGEGGRLFAECQPGEIAVGGGWSTNSNRGTRVHQAGVASDPERWIIDINNEGAITIDARASVVCLSLVSSNP